MSETNFRLCGHLQDFPFGYGARACCSDWPSYTWRCDVIDKDGVAKGDHLWLGPKLLWVWRTSRGSPLNFRHIAHGSTLWVKKVSHQLNVNYILTDFHNCFTDTFNRKFEIFDWLLSRIPNPTIAPLLYREHCGVLTSENQLQ